MPEVQLTEAGRKELEERLEYLKSVRRAEIAEEIKTARGFGDLSEKRRVRRRAQSSGGNGRRNSGNRSDAASCKIIHETTVTCAEIIDGKSSFAKPTR